MKEKTGGYYLLTIEGKGFIKAGGFKAIEAREKAKQEKVALREKDNEQLIKLQIDVLKKKVEELDTKNTALEKELKEEQLNFFKSSTERNKKQILYYVIVVTIAIFTFFEGIFLPVLRSFKIIKKTTENS
ncbi:MAG: hypothetical protein ACI976_001626 [Aureispira sp.]